MNEITSSCEKTLKTRKKGISEKHKVCQVCGDKALGCNFNVVTCESCKAFFRRNALITKDSKCPFTGNCQINSVTRKFCTKCRLAKCFSVGMIKELIMSQDDIAKKRKKIKENRIKKQHSQPDDMVTSSNCNPSAEINRVPYSPEIQYDTLSSTTLLNNSALNNEAIGLGREDYNPSYEPNGSVPYDLTSIPFNDSNNQFFANPLDNRFGPNTSTNNILQQENVRCAFPEPTNQQSLVGSGDVLHKAQEVLDDLKSMEQNCLDSAICEAIKLEFDENTYLNSSFNSTKSLNEVEQARIAELVAANRVHDAPVDDEVLQMFQQNAETYGASSTASDPQLVSVVYMTAVAIKRFIQTAKQIAAFRNLCQEDQVLLLKSGCIEMMLLWSAFSMDPVNNKWNLPHRDAMFAGAPTEILNRNSKGSNVLESHSRLTEGLREALGVGATPGQGEAPGEGAKEILILLTAIVLFTPRQGLAHPETVKFEQTAYYYLLRRRLEAIHRPCKAKSVFLKLLQQMVELRMAAKEARNMYLNVNPVEPLVMEVFDLKPEPES